jgi:hypothetical protein
MGRTSIPRMNESKDLESTNERSIEVFLPKDGEQRKDEKTNTAIVYYLIRCKITNCESFFVRNMP